LSVEWIVIFPLRRACFQVFRACASSAGGSGMSSNRYSRISYHLK
jgi:hypothetical protein